MCFLNYNYFKCFNPSSNLACFRKLAHCPKAEQTSLYSEFSDQISGFNLTLGHIYSWVETRRHISLQLVCYSNNTIDEDAILNNIICKTGQSARKLGSLSASRFGNPRWVYEKYAAYIKRYCTLYYVYIFMTEKIEDVDKCYLKVLHSHSV